MFIENLQISHFRNLHDIRIFPSRNLNFIVGENGAGKSSLLEALYVLSHGKSFRTNNLSKVVSNEAPNGSMCSVFTSVMVNKSLSKFGFSKTKNTPLVLKSNGNKNEKVSEIAKLLPMKFISPESSDLILGSPEHRRKFLDWLVFHVEPDYQKIYSKYKIALKQRNAVLRRIKDSLGATSLISEELNVWTEILAKSGAEITDYRRKYCEFLSEFSNPIMSKYLGHSLSINYMRGWDARINLFEALETNLTKDLKNGFTTIGPHTSDIQFKIQSDKAKEFLSRGQLRLAVALLIISEVKLLSRIGQQSSIILIDDIEAELSKANTTVILDEACKTKSQVFATTLYLDNCYDRQKTNLTSKMFHVEQGCVSERR